MINYKHTKKKISDMSGDFVSFSLEEIERGFDTIYYTVEGNYPIRNHGTYEFNRIKLLNSYRKYGNSLSLKHKNTPIGQRIYANLSLAEKKLSEDDDNVTKKIF